MKKFYSLLAIAMFFFVLPMGMMGQTRATVTDEMTASVLAATGTSYTAFSNVSLTSDAVYAGRSALNNNANIQLRSSGSNSGIVTTTSGGLIKSITITVASGSNTIDVYGKNTAYTSAEELYNANNQGTKIGSVTATGTITVTNDYQYVGIRSYNGAVYISKIEFVWETGTTPMETVATPTFSVAEGTYTSAQSVSISCGTSGATIYYTTNGDTPSTSSSVYSSALTISETTTVKAMAVKSGMNNSSVATATYTINAPYSGPDYVRVTDIAALTDGTQVIIAARYNTTTTSYYAMTASASGKPTGVSFSSTTSSNGEVLPSSILNDESTYYWTLGVTTDGYTFTNDNNKVLGYTSGTNFAEGGNNTAWTIKRATAGSSAMVNGYEGFYITNKNNSGRGIALNTSHNYGPYATSNNNSSEYNFYLDIFVQGYVPATVATPTFSPEAGTFYETQNVTISCATTGADIYYTTDGTEPDANSTEYTGAISVSTTTTIKAIAYYAGANSAVATATYTIEQPISTIPALFAAATNSEETVRITFNNWVVSGISTNGKNVFVTDNNGNGFVIFGSNMSDTYTVGDILSGTAVSCTLKKYNGYAELINLDANDLTITTGGTVSTANVALANLSGVNTGALVHYDGLTCSVTTSNNNTYYRLSDGTTTVQIYEALYAFDALEDGETYNITGIYQQYNSTKEILPRSAADIEEVVVPHEEYTLTIGELSHVTEIFLFDSDNESESIEITNNTATITDGTTVMVSFTVESGYVFQSINVTYGDNQTVETTEIEPDQYYSFVMPAANATLTISAIEYVAPAGDQYELYTGTLVEGDYLIVYNGKAMNNTTSSNRLQYEEVSAVDDVIITDNAEIVWHIAPSGDYWTIFNADANAYAASTGTKNQATTMADGTDGKALWTVSGDETYEFVNKYNSENNINSNLRNNGTYGFACYGTGTGGALSLYKKVEDTPVTETYTLEIAGYDNNGPEWHLIASPIVEDITPSSDNGFVAATEEDFDLYRFNQGAEKEWENWKQTGNHHNFPIANGHGYLYASKEGTTLTFTGMPYNGEGTFDLVYEENAADKVRGLNLVGNPYTTSATVDQDFYIMNEAGTDVLAQATSASTGLVAPMQGIFVKATAVGETVTFTPASKNGSNNRASVVMNLSQNRGGVIDRAIVRFGNNNTLPKFQLFDNSTKLYIAQDGEEFAIVGAEEQGEMPVNFKASENGSYTISINTENVEMGYLHLIDNLTGNDVDLLTTPSYTFNAKTDDYASRFRLVFSAGNADSDNFAFVSNGQIIVNGQGTVQVYDVTGRMISSHNDVNHITTEGMTAGVYVIRLNNGNDVKTQRIVVK